MNYKDKTDKLKKQTVPESQIVVLKDANTKKAISELKDVKKSLESLKSDVNKPIDDTQAKKTNELLEKYLDQAVELQKDGDASIVELTNQIIEQVGKIRPVVNVPASKVVNRIIVQDWKKEYMFSDSDKAKSTTYVGFVKPDGGWYIERITKSETSDKARFIFGESDYVSNWGGRLQHNYKYLYEAING